MVNTMNRTRVYFQIRWISALLSGNLCEFKFNSCLIRLCYIHLGPRTIKDTGQVSCLQSGHEQERIVVSFVDLVPVSSSLLPHLLSFRVLSSMQIFLSLVMRIHKIRKLACETEETGNRSCGS